MLPLTLFRDALEFARACEKRRPSTREILRDAALYDGFAVLALQRLRESAQRRRVPLVNRFVRALQTALYGIEIGKDVSLGPGVCFVHTLGNVIGGDAKIGARVRVLGNVTVGTAKDDGYPTIEDDVTIGAGARVLGPVSIGRGAVIGANAVVLTDVPAGATAVGVPAVIRRRRADAHSEVS
jgi:serine acetyltransferase